MVERPANHMACSAAALSYPRGYNFCYARTKVMLLVLLSVFAFNASYTRNSLRLIRSVTAWQLLYAAELAFDCISMH